jgi:hypothetical protein
VHVSNSDAQLSAERLILDGVENTVGVKLEPRSLRLASGARVEVDGVASDESVLAEVFAHQGPLKGGQRHKIAGDALKLITIARGKDPPPRLVLAFADEQLAAWAAGKSWLASALTTWGIEVIVVELDELVRAGLRDAQARQVMVNPPAHAPGDAD